MLFAAGIVLGLKVASEQWVPLGPYSAGVNIATGGQMLEANELYQSSNFVWTPTGLTVREGFYRFCQPESDKPITFMQTFKQSTGQKYLFYSDGTNLWCRPDLTQPAVAIKFGRLNRGIVDIWPNHTEVEGDSAAVMKFRTLIGTGEGWQITIGDSTYTIAYVLLDTLLYLQSAIGAGATDSVDLAYNIDFQSLSVSQALAMNDNLWFYGNTGKFYFNDLDSVVVTDSLTGNRFLMTTPYLIRTTWGVGPSAQPGLRYTASTFNAENYAGQFLRLTTDPRSDGSTHSPIPYGHHLYTSYPVMSSGTPSGNVFTSNVAFMPQDSSMGAEYFTIGDLEYDSTSKVLVTLDSMVMGVIDSAAYTTNGSEALYIECYKSSWDSTQFMTGDWFMCPYDLGRFPVSMSFDDSKRYFSCLPVVGGYLGSGGMTYVGVGFNAPLSRNDWKMTDHDTCRVWFYRMKKQITNAANAAQGINFALKENISNVFLENRNSNPDLIYYSEPNMPDSFLASHVVTIDPGNPCIIAGEQSGNVIIYTATNRWRFSYAGGGAYAKERLDGFRGCIAKRSFINVDGVHYGLASDGYWESQGDAPQIISLPVASYFSDSLDYGELDKIATGYDPKNDDISLTLPCKDGGMIALVYHRPTKSWWPQSFAASAYAYNGDITISDSVRFLAAGTDSSVIYVQGGRRDDGVAIAASLQTGYLDYQNPELEKRIMDLRFGYSANDTASGSLVLYPIRSVDGTLMSASDSFTFSLSSGWGDQWLRLPLGSLSGNWVAFRMSLSNASGLGINYEKAKVVVGGER